MLILVYFTTILYFYDGQLNVECGAIEAVKKFVYGSEPAYEEFSLMLLVDKFGSCYLVNGQFVTNKMSSNYGEFLFACPAESEENLQLNRDSSKTKNALFIKQEYTNPNTNPDKTFLPSGNVDIISQECKYPVIPSIIETNQHLDNPDISLYLVGYEVFLGKEKIKAYLIDNYEPAGLEDKRFAWFNLYTIAFNRKTHDVVSVFTFSLNGYRVKTQSSNETIPNDKVDLDYFLGRDQFYGEDSQIAAAYKEAQRKDLVGVHLAPLESFGIPLYRRAGQTFANVAPMRNEIYANTWSRIETVVKYLVQGLRRINVTTGTYGVMTISGTEMYLEPDTKSIKVPAAFWKMISYSPNKYKTLYILIVSNNNPEDTGDIICDRNQCRDFGWDSVQQGSHSERLTSCCPVTEKILADLQINHHVRVDDTLNLREVPHWENSKLTLNAKEYLEDRLKGKYTDKRVDDDMYKNNKEIQVKSDEDEEITWKGFLSIVYSNFVVPLLYSVYGRLSSSTDGKNVEHTPPIVDVKG